MRVGREAAKIRCMHRTAQKAPSIRTNARDARPKVVVDTDDCEPGSAEPEPVFVRLGTPQWVVAGQVYEFPGRFEMCPHMPGDTSEFPLMIGGTLHGATKVRTNSSGTRFAMATEPSWTREGIMVLANPLAVEMPVVTAHTVHLDRDSAAFAGEIAPNFNTSANSESRSIPPYAWRSRYSPRATLRVGADRPWVFAGPGIFLDLIASVARSTIDIAVGVPYHEKPRLTLSMPKFPVFGTTGI